MGDTPDIMRGVEVADASPEAQTREQVQMAAGAQRGLLSMQNYLEQGDGQSLRMAEQSLGRSLEYGQRRTVADVVRIKNQILPKGRIEGLPKLSGKFDKEREQQKLAEIRQRLKATQAITERSALVKPNRQQARAYFPMFTKEGETYVVSTRAGTWRNELELDMQWLKRTSAITPEQAEADSEKVIPEERKRVFDAYYDILNDLKALNDPEAEQSIARRDDAKQVREDLARLCRDPRSPKNAAKFTALLALGGMLALWGIMDYRKNQLSFATLALLGGVLYLMKNGSKFDFLSTSQFATVAREGMDGAATRKLQALAQSRPAAFNHLVKTMDECNYYDKQITEETIKELTEPKKKRSGQEVLDTQRRVPEDIARLFIGMQPGNVAFVLKGLRSTARSNDRPLVAEFAEANNNRADIQQDLQALSTAASSSAPSGTPPGDLPPQSE